MHTQGRHKESVIQKRQYRKTQKDGNAERQNDQKTDRQKEQTKSKTDYINQEWKRGINKEK